MAEIMDLRLLKRIAEKREDENMRFRTYIKNLSMNDKKLDKIVFRLNKTVSEQIDCDQCGNCCQSLTPEVSDQDILQLTNHLKISEQELHEKYLEKPENEYEKHQVKGLPCSFLSGTACSLGNSKPEQCKSYPYLDKKGFRSRLLGVVANYEICPIVFNVYEMLKDELNWDRDTEWSDYGL